MKKISTLPFPIFLVLAVLAFACHSNHDQGQTSDKQSSKAANPAPARGAGADTFAQTAQDSGRKTDPDEVRKPKLPGFFDSIAAQYDLTIAQIEKYTLIDSFYYSGFNAEAQFTGDSLFLARKRYRAAILKYSDHKVCGKKLLLIFDSLPVRNIAFREIAEECDRDGDEPFSTTSYKILNDSVYQTMEKNYKDGSEGVSSVDKIRWKIGADGKIDTLRKAKH